MALRYWRHGLRGSRPADQQRYGFNHHFGPGFRFSGWLVATLLFIGFWFVPPALATGIYNIPPLDPAQPTWVLDQADALSPLSQGKLERTFSTLAKNTNNEVRLVIIRRLDYEETPASFADQLFQKWFTDSTAGANQVLLVLDTVTNGTAIITGEKVQQQLTPAIAESVAQETMRVPLRDGNYNQAALDAAARLEAVLSGQPDPGPPDVKLAAAESTFTSAEETDDRSAAIIVVVLLVLATVIPMVTYFFYQGSS